MILNNLEGRVPVTQVEGVDQVQLQNHELVVSFLNHLADCMDNSLQTPRNTNT